MGEHAVDYPFDFWRDGRCGDDRALDFPSLLGWHEAVCASIVDHAPSEVGAPGLGVEECEQLGFLLLGNEAWS